MVASSGRVSKRDVKSEGKDSESSLERIGIGKVKYLRHCVQFFYNSINPEEMEKELHTYAKKLLSKRKVRDAWQMLIAI